MTRTKQSVLGRAALGRVVVGAVASALAAVLAAGPAQAAGTPAAGTTGQAGPVRVAPAAPRDAQGPSDRAAAAVSPTVSPSVRTLHVATGEQYTCDWGNLCGEVWDPAVGKWKIFYFYACNRYSLAHWSGLGDYLNAQTGGAVGTFYGRDGSVLRTVAADAVEHSQDWTPVWSVRNC
ncbi:hypothetical protein ACIQPQ_27285 [Streptomyces sp. NPDC091281]|uniref:hypothetical protein n=1 Tax=Streptomyces sp. NPDC091281 TaxID=3365985 RepID=UPI003825E3D3